ncbi:hypothetical protein LC605_09305 [Nostoc sp. CHAB 5836]|uniref:hypothetical protein n=1 Tax=Nostoc sp. CHAB 5836 TaxID=2780404 RepID=UPI001E33416E|nr:hypothetical protein [Nostoc sp. CHAB 5836]MCC5615268.1 hypothetical protein [Nostoc sp. CHAB 5836]
MLNKRFLCGFLAATSAMATIAFCAPSSYANPAVKGTSSVVRNVRKLPRIKPPKNPAGTIRRIQNYDNYCKQNPNAWQCPFHRNNRK